MPSPNQHQPTKVSIPNSLAKISSHWSPKLVASLNNSYDIKIVKVSGDFVWHSHPDTDELFYILSGNLTIKLCEPENKETEDLKDVNMSEGDMIVIPKGVRHCPATVGGQEVAIMLIEPSGVVNTGDAADTKGLKAVVEDFR
ncbi:hypothetical protein EYZ11_000358 [Aspergillus tanneri]|uniref:Cupin type-2 domain-containing protein n=1 Tax=Aspergillus tanneri TaxID=1220188 RepID=A0A4S3JXB6_9EURO|nr:uncharacterized protein ATNIH1004_004279 [Aspergillus tanneri]KAA8648394.1 hypothetical protein ATNIH1004_004279 [Aspergillus tanneri]THD00167.1 hypothetical protein EYZ11_000358 [Aspergillus tanneri]